MAKTTSWLTSVAYADVLVMAVIRLSVCVYAEPAGQVIALVFCNHSLA